METLLAKAIEKASAKTAKKLDLKEGVYKVDETLTIRVTGQIKKFKDEEYTPTADIPLKAALALVLEKSGVTREAATNMLVEAMTEALEAGDKAQAVVQERLNDIDQAMARVQAATAKLPDKTRKGKTLCKVSLEVLETAVA